MFLLSFFLSAALAVSAEPVRVEQGLLSGTPGSDPSVMVFKGVPFAAPPVGDLRWREPQPPASWKGVRKADQFSANCIQVMREGLGPWTSEYQPHGITSEDCLYLNIWTTAPVSKARPVLVYIHGGAFRDGSGNVPVYDGENMAKKGIVVVTINYRVGVMGFLAHSDLTKASEHHASGNYGLLDQVAALQWIKRNIAAFGGDPERVTIMGQSAGASSVHYLIASPLARGLFTRAIAESGSRLQQGPSETLATAEQNGVKFASTLGAPSLTALKAMPAEKVLAAVGEAFRFGPIVDGWFLPKTADEIFAAGEQNDVATLTGWTADEGSFSADYGKVPASEFRERIKRQADEKADEILKLYSATGETISADSQKSLLRDLSLTSMYLWALQRTKSGRTDVYTYVFTHPQPGSTKDRYLAFHSSELPYVLDNLNQSNRPWTAEDKKLASTMSTYWLNFIATGNPNGNGLPEWSAINSTKPETMELGDTIGMRTITESTKFEVLKAALEKRVAERRE